MPTLNDLYYTFIGNKDLKPEYTTQYDVGITFSHTWNNHWLKSLDLQIDGYYSEVDDKIIAMPTSNQFRWTMINLGHVEIRGLDAAIRGEWGFGKVEARFLIYLGMEVPSSSMEVTKHGPVTIVSFIQVNVMKQSPISRRTTHSPGIPTIFPYPKLFNGGKREYV